MHLLLINGSPHERGCTYTALSVLRAALEREGVTSDLFFAGEPLGGCRACGGCRSTHRCALGDSVNEALDLAGRADGYVFASPVHYASVAGGMKGFLDRFFFAGKPIHRGKVGAAVAVCRRAGGTSALAEMTGYFPLASMTALSAGYWNILFGTTPDAILSDTEGVENLRRLAHAFAAYPAK